MKILFHIFRVALGTLFMISGVSKINQPYVFLSDLYGFALVNSKAALLVATILPWVESLIGFCLIIGVMVLGSSLGATILAGVFCIAMGTVLYRGLSIECGCFGGMERDIITWWSIARTGTIFLVALICFSYATRQSSNLKKPRSQSSRFSTAVDPAIGTTTF